ncbi:hypothetical protein PENFLA_c140G00681 [Penicillium flavigenum]|uniref:Uncharacterized protein n=1 Tax=Penicillium flavigenum TaxID=254877 RepID=A0A1V6S2U6_9EURO|nr:hypothetical protein PENFLA_c140G00681 [Penicillium flavigenum]
MGSSPDASNTSVGVLTNLPQPLLQSSMENAEVVDTSMLPDGNSHLSPTDMRTSSSIRSFDSSEGQDQQSRMKLPYDPFSPKADMPESHPHVLSAPSAPHRDKFQVRGNAGDDADILEPEPGRESDFELNKLLNPKNFGAFRALGGLSGLEKGLRTDARSGLSMDEAALDGTVSFDVVSRTLVSFPKPASSLETLPTATTDGLAIKQPHGPFSDRRRVFGINKLPERKLKSIWELVWIAYNDKVLILLSIAAAVSLTVGIPQYLRATGVEWVEGAAIIVAILVVVTVGAANDWQKERQFAKLNKKKEDRYVKVIRSGKTMEVSIYDVVVGEVMYLELGDLIPADGIMIDGHDVKCDESSVTGESELLRKTAGSEVYRADTQNEDLKKMDPFIMSGAKVEEGIGTFLVTAIGVHTAYGRTMMSLQNEGEITPLQVKLDVLADYIAKIGLASGLLLFVALFIKFLVRLEGIKGGADAKGHAFLRIFTVAVTIVVVAVPEGLPLQE